MPTADQGLAFQPGNFLHAIRAGEWLVIDEINRAEIDKAFGELFTVLSGQQVDTPYRVGGARPHPAAGPEGLHGWIPRHLPSRSYDYVVHPHWRIIGTMNVYDRASLYAMSLAFMRRFAFIDLGLPDAFAQLRADWVRVIPVSPRWAAAVQDELLALLTDLLAPDSQLMTHRAGTGHRPGHDRVRGRTSHRGAAMGDLLADAFLLFAAAPVGRSGRRRDPGHSRRAGHALRRRASRRARILARIAALYPFIDFGEGA
ncbi:MAG: AAA family ATPase [Caldilineaceae bacterium]